MKNIKNFIEFFKKNKEIIYEDIVFYATLGFAVIGAYSIAIYLGKLIF